jgi:membrane-associated protease RseP (regulator of RpoE activity)
MTLKKLFVHGGLFALTFITTSFAGVAWLNLDPLELMNLPAGLLYASLLVMMLLTHEMGHFIAARLHGVDATLPYFLPFPTHLVPLPLFPFGTLGAVIQLRSRVPSRRALLDIGAAGPIAGFIVSVVYLYIGFRTLPSIEYLYTIHPLYRGMPSIPTDGLIFGSSLLYSFMQSVVPSQGVFIPPMNEIYHYPFLCVGWFGLFMTAMNLLPVGQLDGGHITRAMFGDKSRIISRVVIGVLALVGLLGFLPLVGLPDTYGWSGWLFWAGMLYFVFERKKRRLLAAAPLRDEMPPENVRKVIGWTCIAVFLIGFSLAPFAIAM